MQEIQALGLPIMGSNYDTRGGVLYREYNIRYTKVCNGEGGVGDSVYHTGVSTLRP